MKKLYTYRALFQNFVSLDIILKLILKTLRFVLSPSQIHADIDTNALQNSGGLQDLNILISSFKVAHLRKASNFNPF